MPGGVVPIVSVIVAFVFVAGIVRIDEMFAVVTDANVVVVVVLVRLDVVGPFVACTAIVDDPEVQPAIDAAMATAQSEAVSPENW